MLRNPGWVSVGVDCDTAAFAAVTGLISFLFLKEKLTWRKSAGILLAILGILAVNVMGADIFGLLMFLPFSLNEARRFDFAAVALQDWIPIVYYGIAVTVIAFVLWYQGVAKVPASTAAIFTGVLPISAVLLSYVILNPDFASLTA